MVLLPSQSVNDLRLHDGDGTIMPYVPKPGDAPGSLTNTPSAVVWTAPV